MGGVQKRVILAISNAAKSLSLVSHDAVALDDPAVERRKRCGLGRIHIPIFNMDMCSPVSYLVFVWQSQEMQNLVGYYLAINI